MKVKNCVKTLLTMAFCVLSLSGCATMFKNNCEEIYFDSEPQGAEVYVNGNRFGRTPLALDFSTKKPLTVTFKKEGFEDKTCVIDTKLAAGWVVLDVLGGFIPVVIDAATENWYTLASKQATASLEPVEVVIEEPIAAEVVEVIEAAPFITEVFVEAAPVEAVSVPTADL